jgi:tetratricopeptide (TPR) repeat protein
VAIVGRLAGMSRRDAQQIVRERGGIVLDDADETADWIVLGGDDRPAAQREAQLEKLLAPSVLTAIERGTIELLSETELWQRLGLVDAEHDVQRLYTPAMLAELVAVPLAMIRRWHRRGLIRPTRQVRRLPYFDFAEVATARRLAELSAAGISAAQIERKLKQLSRMLPHVERPLAQLSTTVEGKSLLVRQGEGLIEPGGQLRFDFDATAEAADEPCTATNLIDGVPRSPEELLEMAAEMEESGQLEAATDLERAALAAGGPNAEICFTLAELLYRQGNVAGAIERYYMAVELDEHYVEARANLGCVLAETGRTDLAVAALEGALAYHPDYADAHYHLARTLDDLDRADEAEMHWRAFLQLAPDSPWAETARDRLQQDHESTKA